MSATALTLRDRSKTLAAFVAGVALASAVAVGFEAAGSSGTSPKPVPLASIGVSGPESPTYRSCPVVRGAC